MTAHIHTFLCADTDVSVDVIAPVANPESNTVIEKLEFDKPIKGLYVGVRMRACVVCWH